MGTITGFIKRSAISLILIAVFCLSAFAITRPMIAELHFAAAGKMVKEYKWAQAEGEFRRAIAADPFNSKYPVGLGDFLAAQTSYQAYKEPLLKEAERLCRRAVALDPRNAECRLELGLIEMNVKAYDKAFKSFRKAAENDPNGFSVSYSIGIAGLGAWKNISEADRAFVADRLKVAVTAKPSDDIYAKAWSACRDIELLRAMTPDSLDGQQWLYGFIVSRNLWQFRKDQAQRLRYYREKESPDSILAEKTKKDKRLKEAKDRYGRETGASRAISQSDWRGSTPDGKFVYENGNMYWTGTIDAAIDMPEGNVTIMIRAKGQPADGIYPYMIIELDGEEAGETLADSADLKEYEFKAKSAGGVKVLSVTFANDGGNAKEDRNLFVGTAEVVKAIDAR